uniref:cytochrome-c oxidase n=1 Tax=Dicrocoelium chinensis TaxID=483157 RepID=A0A096XCB0_DICCN|nr:cytochrome c oxidase subunit 2 [Dicrocoelium chinensis]AHG06493.1 cytochrome c oxidase subunit 2 [Dicrocoelium chinensis]
MLVVPLCAGSVLLYSYLYLDLVRYMLFLCSFVSIWVFVALGWQFFDSYILLSLENENDSVELAWTVIPTIMVIGLCYFNLRCLGPDIFTPIDKVVKIVGHQWYWGYEVLDASSFYDSLIGDFISSVDKPLRLGVNENYSFVVTSSDVIHSFVIPAFNVKLDAVPGRINQLSFFSNRVGVFVGYCSELCGGGWLCIALVVEIVSRGKN